MTTTPPAGSASTPTPGSTTPTPSAPKAAPVTEATAGPAPLGDAGYNRLVELLEKPPVNLPGLPPPATGVPTDLKQWLRSFKEPLALMTVDAAVSAAKAKIGGYNRGRLKELYAQMTPAQITDVMKANVATLKKYADQRVNEAVMLTSITDRLTTASASFLLSALSSI